MTSFTGWLAHLDVPTTDLRILTAQFVSGSPVPEGWLPVMGPGLPRHAVGVIRRIWIEDDWLRCRGELNLGALPVGYRVRRVGAEIDVDSGDIDYPEINGQVHMRITGWRLQNVVIGDHPAWPDARLELDL